MTVRPTSSIVGFAAILVVAVVLVVDAAARGRWDVVVASLPASGLAVWAGAGIFALPCLRITDAGLEVVNILSTTAVPWSAVESVSTRYQVVVSLKDGSRVRSWGAPASARASRGPDNRQVDAGGRMTSSSAQRLLAEALVSHATDDRPGTVRRTWHWAWIGTGALLLATVAVQVAIALR